MFNFLIQRRQFQPSLLCYSRLLPCSVAECLLGKRGRNSRGMEEETSYVLLQKSVSQQAVKMVDSAGKSVRNLAETLHSLLGHKAHLTSNWVKSVCDIIKTLPISEKPVVLQPTDIDTIDDHDSACTTISKVKGNKLTFVCIITSSLFFFPSHIKGSLIKNFL